MNPKLKFPKQDPTGFANTLTSRVDAYFIENHISKYGNNQMRIKVFTLLAAFVSLYLLIVLLDMHGLVTLALTMLLGFCTALIGFNISHDAVHGSLFKHKLPNKILSYTFNMAGASSYLWKIMHNVIHHTYTNVPGHDDDLEPVPFIRLSLQKKIWKVHRYQYWYAFLFYSLTTLSWVFVKDYKQIFKRQYGNFVNKQHPVYEYIILFASKLAYYFLFLALPIMLLDWSWWWILAGFVAMHVVEGLTLAIVFQLAHVVENTEFVEPDAEGRLKDYWAIHQMKTTADFARKSALATWCFGGLNFQVEHHLFPDICHIHYRNISKIVETTAHEFGVPYNENKTMWQALASHVRMLKNLGAPEAPVQKL